MAVLSSYATDAAGGHNNVILRTLCEFILPRFFTLNHGAPLPVLVVQVNGVVYMH